MYLYMYMYMYMYVCMYVCMCIYIYIYVCMYVCMCIYIYIYIAYLDVERPLQEAHVFGVACLAVSTNLLSIPGETTCLTLLV